MTFFFFIRLGKHHVTNGEWDILDFTARSGEEHYECCEAPVSQVIYTVSLKRRPMYFFLYLIFPVIAIVFLSLLIFKIPPDTGERIGFAVTILLTMGVYLMVISQDLPRKADNAPLVGVLYVTLFYVMVLGTTTGVLTAGMSFKVTTPPSWLRRIVLKLSRKNSKKIGAIRNSFRSVCPQRNCSCDDDSKSNFELQSAEISEKDNCTDAQQTIQASPRKQTAASVHLPLKRQSTNLMFSTNFARAPHEFTQKEVKNQEQWQEIAYFLDRLFFWIYFVAIILASCSVLLGLELKYVA